MLTEYYEASGEYPGILGFDIRYSNLVKLGDAGMAQVATEAAEYTQNGGIITVSAHFANPTYNDPSNQAYPDGNGGYVDAWRGELGGDDKWAELVTDGTELNTAFMTELRAVADFLALLRDNGVIVIWRPLHEANTGAFWWCMPQEGYGSVSEERYKALWIYIYDYFADRGLDNLIWEYSPNISNESGTILDALYGFPGRNYVDMVSFDWYTGDGTVKRLNNTSTYSDLSSLGMIVNLSEFGPAGDMVADSAAGEVQSEIFSCEDILGILTEMNASGKRVGYVLTWTNHISIPRLGKADVLMQSGIAIGQAELKAMLDALG